MKKSKVFIMLLLLVFAIVSASVRVYADEDLPPEDSSGGNEVIVGWSYLARIQKGNLTIHAGYDDYKSLQRIVLLIYDDNLSLIHIARVNYNQTYNYSGIVFLYTGSELKVENATIVDLIPYKRRVCSYIDMLDHINLYVSMSETHQLSVQIVQDFPEYHKVQVKILTDAGSQVFLMNYDAWYRIYTHTWLKLTKTNESRFYATFHSYYKLEVIHLAPQIRISLSVDKSYASVNEPINLTVEVKIVYKNGTEVYPSGVVRLSVINKTSGAELKAHKVFIESGVGYIILVFDKPGPYRLIATYEGVSNTIEVTIKNTTQQMNNASFNPYVLYGGIALFIILAIAYWFSRREGVLVGS